MLTIDRNSSEPIYLQLRGHLIKRIRDNQLRPGSRLPSIRTLSRQLGVAPLTVWNAVKALAGEGILSSNGGRGTFVTEQALTLLAGQDEEERRNGGREDRESARKVALILPNLGDPLGASISRGVRDGFAGEDWAISVFDAHEDGLVELDCLRRLRKEGLAGAIVHPTGSASSTPEIIREILDGVPLVLVDRYFQEIPCWYATSDNFHGGFLAASHLLERGRKRIAMVSGTFRAVTVRQRLEGFLSAMAKHGAPVYHQYIVDTNGPAESVAAAVKDLLALPQPPDAFFFGNDYDAMAGSQAIQATGRSVPQDVAVVGFDGHPLTPVFQPALTTVQQDGTALGRAAAELFREQLTRPADQRSAAARRIIPVELIVRQSS
jgi:DNA-binding LacI/PurR family transcriptional regulator/DNA-binding transcriptional regulator YhcF (GntR family)